MTERIARALISTYDKSGVVDLARDLALAGVRLVSTGSTAKLIAQAGIPVTAVEDVTGFAECLDGRVKTLHPAIHAGILADRTRAAHRDELTALGIEPFDLVVVNLYPFASTIAAGATIAESIEQIDIGGPTMVRAAAKNHGSVAVVVDPARYDDVRAALTVGGFTDGQRADLAAEAFAHTAAYDAAVATWMATVVAPKDEDAAHGLGDVVGMAGRRTRVLRYGENPHQRAALYRTGSGGIAGATQLHGKAMSYNNYVDADAAWQAAHDFTEPSVAIIKHANPCGIASGDDIAIAHANAHACDPISAYGGVVAANRPVTVDMAERLAGIFTEVIVAPAFEPDALAILTMKAGVRLLVVADSTVEPLQLRHISGGVLAQDRDRLDAPGDDPGTWRRVAGDDVDEATMTDLVFAWRAVRAPRSNAILLASKRASVGIGMGQVNRVDSCTLAVTRAGDRATGSVAASDAFFPFADGVNVLIDAGVRAIVQPGGSIRDSEVFAAAEAAGVSMFVTGTRHFAH